VKVEAGDYLLLVDKPVGPTSHDVVAAARSALGNRRVGHTGTLDPFASGLLVLCVGRATRLAEYLSGMDKEYLATARLGTATDTLDTEGEVTSVSESWRTLEESAIEAALRTFCGEIDQVPPQYSAKKVDGEAMHRRARRGDSVELAPTPVTVHDIALISYEPPDVCFSLRCSSGTYVRAIARDLGLALETGAHLTALRRTRVGDFHVSDAVPADELELADSVARARLEPAHALRGMASLMVDAGVAGRLIQGQRVRIQPGPPLDGPTEPAHGVPTLASDGTLVAVSVGDDLLAIAELTDGVLRPRKVFPA
jgi:tRNA pseudouridine55 synthase